MVGAGCGPEAIRLRNPYPNNVPHLTALNEAGNLACGVTLEDLADAWITFNEEYIASLCVPCCGLMAISRANELSVQQREGIGCLGILEPVSAQGLRERTVGRCKRWRVCSFR